MRENNYSLLDIAVPVAFVVYALYAIGRSMLSEGVDRINNRIKNRLKGKNLERKLI